MVVTASKIVRKLALLVVVLLGAQAMCAQTLGEIARRERARRATLETRAPVLTNEDLQRSRILPEPRRSQRAVIETAAPAAQAAGAACSVPPVEFSKPPVTFFPAITLDGSVPLWKVADQPGFSLGLYVRQLREQRMNRQAEAAMAQASPHSPDAAAGVVAATTPVLLIAPSVFQPGLVATWSPPEEPSLGEYSRRLQAAREQEQATASSQAQRGGSPPAVARRRSESVRLAAEAAARSAGVEPLLEAPQPGRARLLFETSDPIKVCRGDSLWKLSRLYLGEGKLWVALWKANPEVKNPHLIRPGQLLRWPGAEMLAQSGRSNERAAAASRHQSDRLAPSSAMQDRSSRSQDTLVAATHLSADGRQLQAGPAGNPQSVQSEAIPIPAKASRINAPR